MQTVCMQVIIFSFSKRECEELANQMLGIDLNSEPEKRLVQGIFDNAVDVLAQEDRDLAQVRGVLPMLQRGVGVHHSGLLPIVKEVIEILFQEGLLKARPPPNPRAPYASVPSLWRTCEHLSPALTQYDVLARPFLKDYIVPVLWYPTPPGCRRCLRRRRSRRASICLPRPWCSPTPGSLTGRASGGSPRGSTSR